MMFVLGSLERLPVTGFATTVPYPLKREKESSSTSKTMEEKTPAGQPIVDREKVSEAPSRQLIFPHSFFPDGTLSHTRIRQSWFISPIVPISRWPSPNYR
jgi:hypothetical protein